MYRVCDRLFSGGKAVELEQSLVRSHAVYDTRLWLSPSVIRLTRPHGAPVVPTRSPAGGSTWQDAGRSASDPVPITKATDLNVIGRLRVLIAQSRLPASEVLF